MLHGIPVFAAESSEMIEFKHMERLLMVMIGIEFLLVYQVQLSHIALMVL